MKTAGFWMIVFGALDFALPRFGFDLTWFEFLGRARDGVAAGLLVVGLGLLIVAWRRKRAPGG